MLSQLMGAVVRAIVVMVVIATPSLLLPGTSQEGAQMVTLIGLVLAVFIGMEYASTYPGLVEFRDAPPFNRVRIIALFFTLFFLSIIAGVERDSSTMGLVINAVGLLIGAALDFPYSPLRLILDHLPPGVDTFLIIKVQAMVGLAVFVGLISLTMFTILIRLQHWPTQGSAFNFWINLPTFDPTTGGDVVARLIRDSRVNIIMGFASPFLIPILGVVAANHVEARVLASPHTMVWGVTLWMFIPLSLFMRGLAMGRIADMIRLRRARLVADLATDAPHSAPV